MNNGLIFDEYEEKKPQRDEKEIARLTKIVEAVDGLLKTKEWLTLQELHFTKEEERINHLLLSESKRTELDDREIYRLQGEMKWAKRYADIRKWAEFIKKQLTELKKR